MKSNFISKIFFPEYPYCIFCKDEKNLYNSYCCVNCIDKLSAGEDKNIEGVDIFSAYKYAYPIANIIHKYKYSDNSYLYMPLGSALYNVYSEKKLACDVITNVPLNKKKKNMRGFDQAQLLARELAYLLKKPYRNLLTRTKDTQTQTKLNEIERKENVLGVFEVARSVQGKRIVLVDDVFTTGATTLECAKTLRDNGGAENVIILTVAQT